MIEVINETNETKYVDEITEVLYKGLDIMKVENAYMSVVIVDNKKIHEINKTYRNVDRPTDVISFAFEDNEGITPNNMRILGEIYLSVEKAKEQAKEFGHSEKREICYLSIHGLLHLLGYNHEEDEEKKVMRSLEEKILNECSLARE